MFESARLGYEDDVAAYVALRTDSGIGGVLSAINRSWGYEFSAADALRDQVVMMMLAQTFLITTQ